MSSDMLLALELAGLGMSYVFIFLGALILLLYLNAWLVQLFVRPESDVSEEQQAATTAVAVHHRRRQS